MNVLVLGSGGREHALCWKISRSSLLTALFIAPGNAGTSELGTNVDLDPLDFPAVKKFVLSKNIRLVIVGPEAPLVAGITDYFKKDKQLKDIAIVGPDKAGARLEGSKDFAKKFMQKNGIPTARYETFTEQTLEAGYKFLDGLKAPYVLKADGLAAGKGVLILDDLKTAKAELKSLLTGKTVGDAGKTVVIEEFLKGIEMSAFVVTDGTAYKMLPEAKDYKRIGEGDKGANTGGMGAISPVPFATLDFMEKIENQIIIPTMKGLKNEGINYTGFIFFGIMKVGSEPYVIEYNCRLGDPETEVIIPRIKSDLLAIFEGIATNTLSECDLEIDERTAATVMLASKGYPEKYEKGKDITGLGDVTNSLVFHAGTKHSGEKVVTNGGRVLAITSYGNGIDDALRKSYVNAETIDYKGKYYRKDIGFDLKKVAAKAPQASS
jgi:phosphoribosylamine--glycine ligase